VSWQALAAFLDVPERIVVEGSTRTELVPFRAEDILLRDDEGRLVTITSVALQVSGAETNSRFIVVIPSVPLDPRRRVYRLGIVGLEKTLAVVPRGVLNDPNLFGNPEAVLGASYSPKGTTFRLFAPTADAVEVVFYASAKAAMPVATHSLARSPGGLWEVEVPGDLKGLFYTFRLRGPDLPGEETLDIYAVHAIGNRGRITDLKKTNPPGWEKARLGPAVASPVDMVIYEMHVRDFTISLSSGVFHGGRYLGFAEAGTHLLRHPKTKTGLDHLTELGITHVQLMPVQDFGFWVGGDAYNWGYMTVAFNSPEGWYATRADDDSRNRELKALIKALHERGIGVIMDVVYNHTACTASFDRLVPRYYYRYWPDGSFANGPGTGNEFCSERPMARKFILDSLKYWVLEYGVDGFRFDLMSLIDLETMHEIERELRRIRPDIVLYGEPWVPNPSPMTGLPTNKDTLRTTGLAAFNDDFRNALKGWVDGNDKGFIQDGSKREEVIIGLRGSWGRWPLEPFRSINYMTCHDNLVLYDKLRLSMPEATEEQIKETMKLGYLLLLTSQGIPFIYGGEEFMRTKRGHSNSYDRGDTINQVDWTLKQKHNDLFSHVRDLIAIRKAHPVFRLRSASQVVDRLSFLRTPTCVVGYLFDGAGLQGERWTRVCVLANSSNSNSHEVELPEGSWFIGYDWHGAADGRTLVDGRAQLRYKAGMILYVR
jgi:pullulanase